MNKYALIFLPSVAACFPPAEVALIDPAIPADVDLVAVLGLDARGELVSSTGLISRSPGGEAFALAERPEAAVDLAVFGWSHTSLPVVDARTLFVSHLRSAAPGAPSMPAPAWSRVFSREGAPTEKPAPDLHLTADWMPACPRVVGEGELYVEASCSVRPCAGSVRQDGCELIIDTADCALGTIRARVTGRGDLDLTSDCTRNADSSIDCMLGSAGRCRISVYDRDDRAPFEVTSLPLGAPLEPNPSTYRGGPGVFSGMVALEGAIAVAHQIPYFSYWLTCPPPGSSRFTFVDLETMTTTTTSAPECLTRIARDPTTDGATFFGFYRAPDPRVGRFDARGRLIESAPIMTPMFQSQHWVSVMAAIDDPPRIALVASSEGLDGRPVPVDAFLISIDAADLTAQSTSPYFSGNTVVLAGGPAGGSLFATVDNGSPEQLRTHDLANLGSPSTASLCEARVSPAAIVHYAPSDRLVFAGTGRVAPSLLVAPCEATTFYGFWANAFALAPWPADPALLVVGLSSPEGETPARSAIALADPRVPRFLSGFVEVEAGVLSYPAVDRRGNVWLASSTRGMIFRISSSR